MNSLKIKRSLSALLAAAILITLFSVTATAVYSPEAARQITPLAIDNQTGTKYLSIDDEALAALGVGVSFSPKRSAVFASPGVIEQIDVWDNGNGPGLASLTAADFAAALSSVDSAYDFIVGTGNVYATPTRAAMSGNTQLLSSGTNMHGTTSVNYTITNPTTSNAVYAFRVPKGTTDVTKADFLFYVQSKEDSVPQDEVLPASLEDVLALGTANGTWGDMVPGAYYDALDAILIKGPHDSVEVYGMFDASYQNIALPEEITSNELTRVSSMDDFAPGTFILQSVGGFFNYIFVFPAGTAALKPVPAPVVKDGTIIPILLPAAGNSRTAIDGQTYWVTEAGIPRAVTAPIDASAINTQDVASGYITYQTGVYRVSVKGGSITDFWYDYDVMDLGYTIKRTGSGTLAMGIHLDEYTYDSSTKFFDFNSFAYVTQADFEAAFPAGTRNLGFQCWTIDEDSDGVLDAFYYKTSTNITAGNIAQYEQFNAVVPDGAKYSIDGADSDKAELKYVYYEPETADPSAVIFWLPGSGAGYDEWQNLSLSAGLLNWTSSDIQKQFDGGAYIVVPSAQVHPVIGKEYRWDNLDGSVKATKQLIALIEAFIENHDIDKNRVYIGGVSVGGGMTMWAIQDSPELFAAAFPVSPTLRSLYPRDTTSMTSINFKTGDTATAKALNTAKLPVWLFMGQGDSLTIPPATGLSGNPTVSSELDISFANELVKSSVDSRVTVFETALHGMDGAHGFPAASVLRNLTKASGSSDIKNAGAAPVTAAPPSTGNTWLSENSASLGSTLTQWLSAQTRSSDKSAGKQYSDVNKGDWFYDSVMLAYTNGLMNGTDSNKFSPNLATSRGMMVTILYRMAGSPDVSALDNPFKDVANDKWYSDAVIWAAANSIFGGYGGGLFGPEDNITREQLATILNNYVNYAELELLETREYTGFADGADCADYAKDAIARFFKATVINGKPGNTFDPKGEATRAEVATMLVNLQQAVK